MKRGSVLTLCLILMLSTSSPILAESEMQDELDLLWGEISSTILPDKLYEGSLVRDVIWEVILAADRAISQVADDAAEKAAAEAVRQLQPELAGWKARAEAAEKESRLRLILGITIPIGVGIVAGTIGYIIGSL